MLQGFCKARGGPRCGVARRDELLDDQSPVIEDTFILGGQSFIYTEQDWSEFPGIASRAYVETSSALAVYQTALQYRSPLVENGRLLTQEQIGFRVMEFLGGLSMLAPHIDTIRCVRRLVNILFVSMSLPFLHDY